MGYGPTCSEQKQAYGPQGLPPARYKGTVAFHQGGAKDSQRHEACANTVGLPHLQARPTIVPDLPPLAPRSLPFGKPAPLPLPGS